MKRLNETKTMQIIGGSTESYADWKKYVNPDGTWRQYCGIIGSYSLYPTYTLEYYLYWNEYIHTADIAYCDENDW